MTERTPKIQALLPVLKRCVDGGRIRLTGHAEKRMAERNITFPEIARVLRTGWHEKRKDTYDEDHNAWDYAIRSAQGSERDLRIVVAVEATPEAVVITVIDLKQ